MATSVVEHSMNLGFLCQFHPNYLPTGTDAVKLQDGDARELEKVAAEISKTWSTGLEGLPDDD